MTRQTSWLVNTGVVEREVTFAVRLRVCTHAHLSQLMYNQIESDVQASETKPSVPALGLVPLPCCPLLTCRPHDSALQITVHTCF